MADDFGSANWQSRVGYSKPGANSCSGSPLLAAVTGLKNADFSFSYNGPGAQLIPGMFGTSDGKGGYILPKSLRTNASVEQIMGQAGLVTPGAHISHGLGIRQSADEEMER